LDGIGRRRNGGFFVPRTWDGIAPLVKRLLTCAHIKNSQAVLKIAEPVWAWRRRR
jgi:hypothetical protein